VSFVVNKVSVVAPTVPEAPAVPVTPTVPAALVAPVAPTAPLAPILPPEAVREIVIARELPGVPVPAITGVNLGAANNIFAFSGITIPNTDVVVYVHSDQALLYRAHSDSSGVWKVNHSQDLIELAPGEHTIYAVAVDSAAKVKSAPSNVVIFTVSRNFWIELFNYLNLKTTAGALVVLVAVAFWLYRIRKKEGAQI
jgi:hypothetical protein